MLTPLNLSDALKRAIENALKGYALPIRAPNRLNKVTVYQQFIPIEEKNNRRNDNLDDSLYPYVLIKLTEGQDGKPNQGGICKGYIAFGTYDTNNDECWRDLFNLIEHVRQHLDKIRFLSGCFVLAEPFRWEVPEQQGVNHMEGLMYFSYEIGKPVPEVDWDGKEFYGNGSSEDGQIIEVG